MTGGTTRTSKNLIRLVYGGKTNMRDVIEVNHLKFNYRKRGVLKDVSFKVGMGKVVGLIGECLLIKNNENVKN